MIKHENEYTPWDETRESETEYYKRMFLAESSAGEFIRNATCKLCGRSLPPDGDCYGCILDRAMVVVNAARDQNNYRKCRKTNESGFAIADRLDAAIIDFDSRFS